MSKHAPPHSVRPSSQGPSDESPAQDAAWARRAATVSQSAIDDGSNLARNPG
ncbi:hypothetical protein [Sorangium sp. So ce124]|uniref:hypothetical protein n=1 Tax=Sorangium sp. So ce124 TaxID=3133280 RepID=UPI003F5EF1CE